MHRWTPVSRLRWSGDGQAQPADALAGDGNAYTAFPAAQDDSGGSIGGVPDPGAFPGPIADGGLQFAPGDPAAPVAPGGASDAGSITAASPPSGFGDVDAAIHGAQARSTYAVTGSGIKIGIISDGFNAIPGDLSTAVADGAIGAYTIVQDDSSSSTDEGLAMAEIIHSIAPGAQVYFYSGDFGESSFAQGITTLAQDGCKIICDDESYLTEPFYQQGAPISAAIDNAVQHYGVSYFTAAGNDGPKSFYEGHFNSSTSFATTLPGIAPNGGSQAVTAFNFGTASSKTPYEQITVPNGYQGYYSIIDLQWDQPFQSISGTGSAYSLQFYLFDANHQLVVNQGYGPVEGYGASGSGNGNDVGQDPVQWNLFADPAGFSGTSTYYLAVVLNGGTVPAGQDQFKVLIGDDASTPIGFGGANAGIGSGTVYGHAADPNAISVGAVPYNKTPAYGVATPQIESFSSSGPGTTLINASGQQLATPQSDGKVTLAAPDGNPTTLPSSEGLNPFYGTSAATPAAAAIAALMLQEDPSLTPAQIESMLAQSAISMANPNVSGAGLVQADAAVKLAQGAKAVPTVTSVAESPGSGDLGIGKSVTLSLTMSAAVTVAGGTPTLSLNDNGTAQYDAAKSSSTLLAFDYTVAQKDASVGSLVATAVNLPAGVTITGGGGSNANLSLAGLTQTGPQIDTMTPTVAVAINNTDDNIANPSGTVTFTFSEAPTAFGLADTSAVGGTLSNLAGSGTSYTATFTAAANTDIGNASVAVTAGSWQEANGNPGAGGSTAPFTVDTVTPTVAVAIDNTDDNIANPSGTVTFSFSEAPTAFGLADTSAVGGTLSNLAGSGTSYTATFTAAANTDIGNASVAVTAGSWQEANGNPGAGGSTAPFTVDTVTPTVAVAIDNTDDNIANPSGTVTFSFSEAPTAFGLADTSAVGGTLSNLAGSGTSYTATFTAAANTDIGNASVAVTAESWQEANGNPGAVGNTAPFTVDTVTPTVAVAIDNIDDNIANPSGTVTFSFSEAPTAFGLADTSAVGGTLSNLAGSGTSYTATFTAGANTDIGNASVAVTAGSWQEANGNPGAGGSTAPFTVDTVTPTVAVAINNIDDNVANPSGTVTFSFSEAPTAFGLADTSAVGGTLSNLAGSGTSYTATFTAAANTDIGAASVAVTAGSWQEANGNPGAGGSTAPFTVDTVTPTVAVAINNIDDNVANPSGTVTFSFSEAPTAFGLADTSAVGGTLSNLAGSGTSYTATFTAAANTDIGAASVAVTAGSWQEANGNPGAGGSTAPFTVDTVTPTVAAIAASPASGDKNAGDAVTLTLTMNENVTVTGTPVLTLNDGGAAVYQSGSGSNTLVFSYTVGNAQNVPALAVTGNNLNGSTIAVSDAADNPADLSGANTTFAGLAIGATVRSVTANPSSGDLGAGKIVGISVTMSQPVKVTGGAPTLSLNDGGVATYKSGSGTNVLNFSYTVAAVGSGQNTPALAVTQFNANGATIYDSNVLADTADLSGATAYANGPQIDTTAATVSSVVANPANGDLNAGKSVILTVTFSRNVTVNTSGGTPTLNLNDGGKAFYTSGTGTNALTFTYVVAAGQNTGDLAATGLSLNGGSIQDNDSVGNNAVLTGAATKLSGILQIATTAPSILAIGANPAPADLKAGKSVTLYVEFSAIVTVGGVTPTTTPFLTLNDLGTATYTGGSGTNLLTFVYTVAAGQNTPQLTVTGLNLNGATIRDGAGNNGVLSGAVSNLGGMVQIDTTPPAVVGVAASQAAGEVVTGQAIAISLAMSEAVTVSGTPLLLLDDGATASYDKLKSSATTAVFDYTPANGQTTTDLAVSGIQLASTSSIQDFAGNPALLAGAGTAVGLQVNTTSTGSPGPSGGKFIINGTTGIELFGPSTAGVAFAPSSAGTLKLDNSQNFAGTIAGLTPGNHLDLGDIGFGANTTLGYTPNGGNSGGTLHLTDGTHTANLALLGSYLAGNLSLSGDGSGGTVVIDAPFGSQQALAAHSG